MTLRAFTFPVLLLAGCAASSRPAIPTIEAPRVHAQTPRIAAGRTFPRQNIPQISLSIATDEKVDVPPSEKKSIESAFHYPPTLVRARMPGDVSLHVTIEADGSVSGFSAVSASNQEFLEAVSSGIRKYAFSPARRGGVSVPCHALCRFTFSFAPEE